MAIAGGIEASQSPVRVAVVQLGHCSGTLVAADVVLTSAHCLDGPVDAVLVDGRVLRTVQCARHPAYEPGRPAHDMGYCRLAEAMPGAIALDEGPVPAFGMPVSLAGFGVSGPLSREKRTLRTVNTSVADVHDGWLDVGSATATACRGDSGGPMLIDRGSGFRVAGVIQGAKDAICASPTQVVPIDAQREWLEHGIASLSGSSAGQHCKGAIIWGTLLLSAVLFALAMRRRSTGSVAK